MPLPGTSAGFSTGTFFGNQGFEGEKPWLVGGCLLTPLKNDGVKVSWDDDIPKIWKVIKLMFQTTNQPWI